MKKRKLITVRIIAVFLVSILIVILGFIVMWRKNVTEAINLATSSYSGLIEFQVSTIEDTMKRIESEMNRILFSTEVVTMSVGDKGSTQYELAKYKVSSGLNNIAINNESIDATFIYDKNYNEIHRTYSNNNNTKNHRHGDQFIDFKNLPDMLNSGVHDFKWKLTNQGNIRGIYKVQTNFLGIYIGVCLNLEDIMEKSLQILKQDNCNALIVNKFAQKMVKCDIYSENDILNIINDETRNTYITYKKGKSRYINLIKPIGNLEISIMYIIPQGNIQSKINVFNDYFIIIISILILLSVSISLIMVKTFVKPVLHIVNQMNKISLGDIEYRLPLYKTTELNIVANSMNKTLDSIVVLQKKLFNEQLKYQKDKVKYLTMQIKPHFIANTLNTIYNLTYVNDTETIRKLTKYLSQYYRYLMASSINLITISDELVQVKNYLEIYKLRSDKTLNYNINVNDVIAKNDIPPLLLLTLMENTLAYGYGDNKSKINIYINGYENNENIVLEVIDDGVGMSREKIDELNSCDYITKKRNSNNSIGIYNIMNRLNLIYGDKAFIKFSINENGGVTVKIQVLKSTQNISQIN